MNYLRKLRWMSAILVITILVMTGCQTKDKDAGSQGENVENGVAGDGQNVTPVVTPEATPTPTPTPEPIDYKNAVIKDVYQDYFTVGAVLGNHGLELPPLKELVITHFNSLTVENEMKPNYILNQQASASDPARNEAPAVDFTRALPGLEFAKENNIKMRGHTLIWHSQTPRWLFTEGYSSASNAELVSREVMLKRMENYIKDVLEYTDTNYPGVIYAWDIVNEAIEIGNKHPEGIRTEDNLWYEVIGDDYVEKAFEYARKYAAPGVKLFYNDYGTDNPTKAEAIKKLCAKIKDQGNIDGIGMQTHIGVASPSMDDIDKTTRSLAELGLEMQVTELDVSMTENTPEDQMKQATRYRRLFMYFEKWVDDGIKLTNVTLWGTTDNRSWLNKRESKNYPLLFDAALEKKPAYYGAIQDPEIPLY